MILTKRDKLDPGYFFFRYRSRKNSGMTRGMMSKTFLKILIITAVMSLSVASSASAGWTEGKYNSAIEFNGKGGGFKRDADDYDKRGDNFRERLYQPDNLCGRQSFFNSARYELASYRYYDKYGC